MTSREACSIDAYMAYTLFDDQQGFYNTQKLSDHFITPSLLKSSYHDLLALWILSQKPERIVEVGAGSGEMAAKLAQRAAFYYIYEKSPYQKKIQQQNLIHYNNIFWPDDLQGIDPEWMIAQEVFDCLPAKMYQISQNMVYEWLIQNKKITLRTRKTISPLMQEYISLWKEYHQNNTFFSLVDCEPTYVYLQSLYRNMPHKGKLLIIDYGSLWPGRSVPDCPLRGYYRHKLIDHPWNFHDILDLTYTVDFSLIALYWERFGGICHWTLPLGEFVADILDIKNTNPLSQDRMLLDPRLMGKSFMVSLLEKK